MGNFAHNKRYRIPNYVNFAQILRSLLVLFITVLYVRINIITICNGFV